MTEIDRNIVPEYLKSDMPREYKRWLELQERHKEKIGYFNGEYYVTLLPYVMYRLGDEDDENAKIYYSEKIQTIHFNDRLFRFDPQKGEYCNWQHGEYEGKLANFEERWFMDDLFKKYGKYIKAVPKDEPFGVCYVDLQSFLSDLLKTEVSIDEDEIYNHYIYISGQKVRIKALREYEDKLYVHTTNGITHTHRMDEFKQAKYIFESITEELEKIDAPIMLSTIYDQVVSGALTKDEFLQRFGKK